MARAATDVIMVIEDDEGTRDALCVMLSQFGYSALLASNGKEALALLRSTTVERPCVILVDLWMPEMDGWEFCAMHQADSSLSEIPTIIVTADARGRRQLGDLGGVAFLPKPIDVDRLIETIKQLC
jgi:CheY-like chemotaxis protein